MGGKFTPGPWRVVFDEYGYPAFEVVTDAEGFEGKVCRTQCDVDTFLIAAAPEMYALLERIHGDAFETLDEGGEAVVAISPDLIEKINLLLAKARGETKEAK